MMENGLCVLKQKRVAREERERDCTTRPVIIATSRWIEKQGGENDH